RKMTNYHFSDQQIDDLIAYFDWIGKVDLNGFPPEPVNALAQAAGSRSGDSFATTTVDAPEIYGQICTACHSLQGSGGNVGPALDGVGNRYDTAYLKKWLKDPQAVKAGTAMPNLSLSDDNIEALANFLSGLK
ncbi:MAG TPA: c-type cytochrome, partial [Trueperaceae bacterium]|nr:c-type cytochrome [Trueperaceae bacterium]